MAQRQSPQGHHEGRGSSRQGPQSRASEYRGQPSRERGQHHEESYEFGNREGEDISSSNAWYSGYRGSEDRDYSASAQGYSGPPLCVLASEQSHYCVARAVKIMGLGAGGIVPVPVDERFRLRARH